MTIYPEIEIAPIINQRHTGIEIPGHSVVCRIFILLNNFIIAVVVEIFAVKKSRLINADPIMVLSVVVIDVRLIIKGKHRHTHRADEPSSGWHPVVGIADTHVGLRKLHFADSSHHQYQRPARVFIISHAAVIVHHPSRKRSGRTALDKRLVVGCRIREVLAVKHIIAVKKKRTDSDRIVKRDFLTTSRHLAY